MAYLSSDEIKVLDKRVDAKINCFAALSFARPITVIHLLRFYEDYLRLYAPGLANGNVDDYLAARKLAQDGFHFAMLWVMQRCPPSEAVDLSLREDAYTRCWPLFQGAMQYSRVWDFLTLLFRGRVVGQWESPDRVRLRYTDDLASEFDVAGRLVAAPDPPGQADQVVLNSPALQGLLLNLNPRSIGGGKVGYELSPDVFAAMKAIHNKLLNHLWELNPSWNVGGYTLAEFREVCLALVTFAAAHQAACFRSGVEGGGLASLVPFFRKDRWEKNIVRWSNVSRAAVRAILSDLTFDQELYHPARRQPDITCQPFFPLGHDILALSISLLLDSNAERNLWELLSITRPEVHSVLRNKKERYWLQRLDGWLSDRGLTCASRIPVQLNRENTDLDLLIVDRARNFGLGCQLKWLTAPDRIRDVEYTDKDLQVGVDQAELSRRWLRTKPRLLAKRLEIPEQELDTIRFQVAVLSKNTVGSSVVYRRGANVPVIIERLMNWVLDEPHRATLETLWKVADNRSYFPVRGVHYSDSDAEAEFAGVHFTTDALGMTLRRPWTPQADIRLPR